MKLDLLEVLVHYCCKCHAWLSGYVGYRWSTIALWTTYLLYAWGLTIMSADKGFSVVESVFDYKYKK